jgi:hypothetical protein
MSEKFPFFLNLTVLPLQREQAQLALSLSPSLLFPALLLFSIYLPLARSLARSQLEVLSFSLEQRATENKLKAREGHASTPQQKRAAAWRATS